MDNEQTPDTIYLRDGNEFPQRVLDLVPSMILRTDADGTITYCNAFMIKTTGLSAVEIVGKRWGDILIDGQCIDVSKTTHARSADELPAEIQHDMILENGEMHAVLWRVTALRKADGAYAGAVFISRNIEKRNDEDRRLFARFDTILAGLKNAKLLSDTDGTMVDTEDFMKNLFDVDRHTSIGYTISEIASNEYSLTEMKDIREGITYNTYRVLELKARHPSAGDIYDIKIIFHKMTFQGRNFIIGIVRDIMFNKIAAEELRESENKFRTIFRDAAISQLLIDDNRYIDLNTKAREMIGADTDRTIVGLTPSDISPEYQPDGMRSSEKADMLLAQALKGGPIEFEWLHLTQKGNEQYSIVMLTPIIIQGKTVLHTIWTDITKRKRAESALHESECKYRSIFEGTSEAILLLSESNFVDCNARALEMFGIDSKENFLHMTPGALSPLFQANGRDSTPEAVAHIRKAYTEGIDRFEWTHRRTNGETFPAKVVLSPFELNGRRVLHATVRDITERKKAEESLRESEARNSLLADIGFEGILIHDNGIAYEVNTSFCAMHGYAREELIGKDVIDMLLADDYKLIGYEKARKQSIRPYELISRKKDGTEMHLELMGRPITFDGREMRVTAMRDITGRKKMETALRQSELWFRTIFESANESIIIRDVTTGEAIGANRKALDMYGFGSVEELSANDIWMDPPYSFEEGFALIQKADTEGPQHFEWCLQNRDGRRYWLDVRLATILIDGKKICLSMFHDITTRKTAEAALRDSEEKFRRITESSLDVIVTTDFRRMITFISPSITRYTGFKPDELTGRVLDSLVPGKDLQGMVWRVSAAMRGEAVGLFETSLYRKDGSHAVMEFSIVPVVGPDRSTGLEFHARDISEKSQLEHEVIRTSELERQRIGQDLHDGLGQALTGISIMIGGLARKIQLGRTVGHREIMLIAKRVEETIEITRRTARGLYPVTMERGGLMNALREMASVVQGHYGIRCTVKLKGPEPDLDIYMSTQFFFIASEAVNNAIKHSEAKSIGIWVAISQGSLTMTIDNDGARKRKDEENIGGMGLKIMEYRARLIEASIHSSRKKNGYRVKLEKIMP